MKTVILKSIIILFAFSAFLSCRKKDEPKPQNPTDTNEEELITTLKLILTEDGTANESIFIFKDLDGAGGSAPTIDNIVLSANKTYNGRIVLLDESKTPADSISNEVQEEGDEHQFFFTVTGANITHQYKTGDVDSKGVPIGLEPIFVTGVASTGTLKVVLKHQPDSKPTSGLGDSSKGETDIEVDFNVVIN